MTEMLGPAVLESVSALLERRMGLGLPPKRWLAVARALDRAAVVLGTDAHALARTIAAGALDRGHIEALAAELTVGETYFFRHAKVFEVLRERFLPALMSTRAAGARSLRIWSAGCASGEEPYSLAMFLADAMPDLRSWRLTVLGTDINGRSLEKARKGVYTQWSFREMAPEARERFFTRCEGGYELRPDIRRLVSFEYLNLAEDSYPSRHTGTHAMDLVLCRNVLMYLVPEVAKRVVGNLHRSLAEGGWLVVGPAEMPHAPPHWHGFRPVLLDGVTLYRKLAAGDEPARSEGPWVIDPARAPPGGPTRGVRPMERGIGALPAVPRSIALQPRAEPARARAEEPREHAAAGNREGGGERSAAREMIQRARVHANEGQLEEAARWSARAIDADRLAPLHQYLHAVILAEAERHDEAFRALRRALYLDPRFVLAHWAMGQVAKALGRPALSRKHLGNALALLEACRPEELVPEADGLTAGRLAEMLRARLAVEVP